MGLEQRLQDGTAVFGVVGLGYVGLPLAVEMAKEGHRVVGLEVSEHKTSEVNEGRSYIPDVPTDELAQLVSAGLISATTDFSRAAECDVIAICVPTPLNEMKEPDTSYMESAAAALTPYLHPDMLITLESTTYPGTTEEIVQPILEAGGLKVGTDLFLAFSPERVDPGNPVFQTKNTPKVVGGITPACVEVASALYASCIDVVSERMGINIWEVVDAAKTKPFGFMPFYPGPGLGGHCIPIDPFYLSWKARQFDMHTEFIELAGKTNEAMPYYVVQRLMNALNTQRKSLAGSRILMMGVAYKANIDDMRESPAIKIAELLAEKCADVVYHDPYVAEFIVSGKSVPRVELTAGEVAGADAVLVVTDHSNVDYHLVVRSAKLILDTRNALKAFDDNKVVRL